MKINEIVNEATNWLGAIGAGIPGVGDAIQAAKQAKSNSVGAIAGYGQVLGMLKRGTPADQVEQELITKGMKPIDAQQLVKDAAYELKSKVDYKTSRAQQQADATAAPEEKFIDQFKLDPGGTGVVTHGTKKYVRDENGNWVFFGSKRTVSPAEERILDQVSPLKTKATTPPVSKQKPISVTDRAGVVFDYDDASRSWYAGAEKVTDPAAIQKLNKAAEVQFQNRQMAHE